MIEICIPFTKTIILRSCSNRNDRWELENLPLQSILRNRIESINQRCGQDSFTCTNADGESRFYFQSALTTEAHIIIMENSPKENRIKSNQRCVRSIHLYNADDSRRLWYLLLYLRFVEFPSFSEHDSFIYSPCGIRHSPFAIFITYKTCTKTCATKKARGSEIYEVGTGMQK